MHENVRLCVECNRQSRSCPVKRLRSSGAERARAAISGAPAEPSGLERAIRAPQRSRAGSKPETSAGAVFSSSQAEQFRAPWRSRASSSGHFERPSRAERARAAISSAPAEPSGLERPFRAPQRSRAGTKLETSTGAMFSSSQAEQFRAPWRSRASANGHFERPSRAERARAAISSAPARSSSPEVANVGRCGVFEARPSRVKSWSVQAVPAPCGNLILDIY